jgi:hypothetical protein
MKTVLASSAAAAALLAASSLVAAQECENGYWETGNGVIFMCEQGMDSAAARSGDEAGIVEETGEFVGDAVETVGEAAETVVEESVETADAIMQETAETADTVLEESVETADEIVPEEEFLATGETVEEPLVTGSIATDMDDDVTPEQFPLNFTSDPECVNGYWETGNGVIMACEQEFDQFAQAPASSTPTEPAPDLNATVDEEAPTTEASSGGSTY